MKFCTLASGSSGNCTLIAGGGVRILVDAGISMKRICAGLRECGTEPGALSGIFITHCHSDHVSGLEMMSKYYSVPIYAPKITAGVLGRQLPAAAPYIRPFDCSQQVRVGRLTVTPFRTSHDAYDSVGYVIGDGEKSMAIVTDLGYVTPEVGTAVCGVDAAVIEANHDLTMLRNGPYPASLKKRIIGDSGHLSNDACASLAVKLYESGTRRLVLAHLSKDNNTPPLAFRTVCEALCAGGCVIGKDISVSIAPRSEKSDYFEV